MVHPSFVRPRLKFVPEPINSDTSAVRTSLGMIQCLASRCFWIVIRVLSFNVSGSAASCARSRARSFGSRAQRRNHRAKQLRIESGFHTQRRRADLDRDCRRAFPAGINRANLGVPDLPAFCTHLYPIDVFKPSRAGASRTDTPDRTCSRNCCCSSAVYRLRMPRFCQPPAHRATWGPCSGCGPLTET